MLDAGNHFVYLELDGRHLCVVQVRFSKVRHSLLDSVCDGLESENIRVKVSQPALIGLTTLGCLEKRPADSASNGCLHRDTGSNEDRVKTVSDEDHFV